MLTAIQHARILVVDDQPANVTLLEKLLANAGYTNVSSTMAPRTVAALHAEHDYDLILLDLHMPEMDGFAVMEQLKHDKPGGYLPTLVITAQPDQKLRALQAGARDFISKPFDIVEVQTRIRNMLEVRMLYRQLDEANERLEKTVLERTAQLRESEARFKSFTQLSSDWYWEQDADGKFVEFAGPVFEMLGIDDSSGPETAAGRANARQRALLDARIASREPFLDLIYTRNSNDGSVRYLQVSGEPMFDAGSRFVGYRGVGMDVTARMRATELAVRGTEQTA
jgi:PAS domain S-box-containing protein